MSSIREKYFEIKNLNNKYLPENIILDLLMLVNNIPSNASLILSFDNECKNVDKLNELVDRIAKGYPYQYAINKAIFNNLELYVDENVLIPRNETMELVNIVNDLIKEKYEDKQINIFDVCAGSGCIGLSLKHLNRNSNVYLSDISKEALNVCGINKDRLNLDVILLLGDMLEPFISNHLKADVIVSNPPYIPSIDTVDPQTLKYEPHLALFASPSTYFYEQIFKQYQSVTNDKFLLAFEIGEDMEEVLTNLCNQYFRNDNFYFLKDMYNKIRFLIIIRE